jgi:hypothetical protein
MKLLKPLLPQLAFLTYKISVTNEHQSLLGQTVNSTQRENIRINTAVLVDSSFMIQPEDEVLLDELEAVRDDLGNIFLSQNGNSIFTKSFDAPVIKLFYRNGETGKVSQVKTVFHSPKLIKPGSHRELMEIFKPNHNARLEQDSISSEVSTGSNRHWKLLAASLLTLVILLAYTLIQARNITLPVSTIEVTEEIIGKYYFFDRPPELNFI